MSDLQSPVELCMVKIGWDKIKHIFGLVGNSSRRLTGASFMLGISPPGIHISRVLKLEVSLESKRLRGLISGNPGHWNEESKDQPIIPQ